MENNDTLSRRTFLQGAAASTLVVALRAEAAEQAGKPAAPAGPPIGCAVIGTGPQGRALIGHLSRIPGAAVKAICDSYPAAMNSAKKLAPAGVMTSAEYRAVLDSKDVSAVFVATPSHLHKQIVLDALQAGKHVYCEAPMAVTMEDARAIAVAGKGAKTVFQVGLQYRSAPLYRHALKFIFIGALGHVAQARAQWHKKDSWRRPAATPERERALNWRLYKETSAGLMGEVGLHQVDVVTWALKKQPVSVQGFGGVFQWGGDDDRTVADTVQCVVEYEGGVRMVYDATLANSFQGIYEVLMGSDSAVILRTDRAYMMKEADASQLGWEVYAKKDKVGDELGIALLANASKHLAQGKHPGDEDPEEKGKDAFYYSAEHFLSCIRDRKTEQNADAEVGYQASVVAIKANEAIAAGTKIAIQKEWLSLG